MKLLTQPGAGTEPLVRAIRHAKKSVDIVIFRFDCREVELALEEAAERGVLVHALIAFTNRGGEKILRQLETRLLGRGITVARTAADLVRYHGKMMIIDRRDLFLLAFNFTRLDIEKSRSFGIVTNDRAIVREAVKLFECDSKRQPYKAKCARLVVSPANAREELSAFIRDAKHQLLVYDVEIADRAILRLFEERQAAGVDVRIIGEVNARGSKLKSRELAPMRLHARAMVRDQRDVFLGSQSLRPPELDTRREIGVIVRERKLASAIRHVFEEDWEKSARKAAGHAGTGKSIRKMTKAIGKSLPKAPALAQVVKEMIAEQTEGTINRRDVEETVRNAVKDAVKDAVRHVVEVAVEKEVATRATGDK